MEVGNEEGLNEGLIVGFELGNDEGVLVGTKVGVDEGLLLGIVVGLVEGLEEGTEVGFGGVVGATERMVGEYVGEFGTTAQVAPLLA